MLEIPPDKLAFIVEKAREFDAEVAPDALESGSDAADDMEVGILEDSPDNPSRHELRSFLKDLNDDEICEVLALVWIGRGDYTAKEWRDARAEARETHNRRAVAYLLETPNFGDLLEEGMSALGIPITGVDE